VNPKTIQRWAKEGQFPQPVYLGGEPRWRESDVLIFLEMRKSDPRPQMAPSQRGCRGTGALGKREAGSAGALASQELTATKPEK